MMTRKEAWRAIARAFRRYYRTHQMNEVAETGLCRAISNLRWERGINDRTYYQMRKQLVREARIRCCAGCYFWEPYWTNALLRARLAERFAKEL